jgi:hypothetical protein
VPGFFNEFGGCLIIGRVLHLLIELEGWVIVLGGAWIFLMNLGIV